MADDGTPSDMARSVTIKGRYRVLGLRAATAEAVTYAAEDAVTLQPVALSVLRGEAAADAGFVAAAREQAQRLARPACHHRALARVYDAGTTDEGEPFVVREPLVGRSLREVLDERRVFGLHDGLRLAIQIGEGLEILHRNGIVHGELKPESVVLVKDENGRDAVKLVGVELTTARRMAARPRPHDQAVAAYLAPEQIARAETTEAADVHALGLLIRELLTGQRPQGLGGSVVGDLPFAIARIVARALEPGPGRRYSSISLMVNDMWSADSEPSQAPARAGGPTSVLGERKLSARHRARSDAGMVIALVVGLLVVGATAWVARSDRVARSGSEPIVAASPVAPAQALPPRAVAPAAAIPAAAAPEKPTPIRTVEHAPRPVARQPGRPSVDQPSADGGDGTAIIDWLLNGGRSGG